MLNVEHQLASVDTYHVIFFSGIYQRLITVVWQHAATPPHNDLYLPNFNLNITLARLMCKLPDDGRIPKHVGAVLSFNVNFIGF